MGSFSDFLENELLDHVFRNSAYTPPTSVYVGLYTTAPSDTGGGTEVTGGAYARVTATFGAASGGAIANSSNLTFTTATATWGKILAAGVFTAATAGTMLAWTLLTASKTISSGDTAQFNAGDVDISLT